MAKLEKRREADFTKKEMIELSGCSSAQDFDYKMKNISKYYDIDLNLLKIDSEIKGGESFYPAECGELIALLVRCFRENPGARTGATAPDRTTASDVKEYYTLLCDEVEKLSPEIKDMVYMLPSHFTTKRVTVWTDRVVTTLVQFMLHYIKEINEDMGALLQRISVDVDKYNYNMFFNQYFVKMAQTGNIYPDSELSDLINIICNQSMEIDEDDYEKKLMMQNCSLDRAIAALIKKLLNDVSDYKDNMKFEDTQISREDYYKEYISRYSSVRRVMQNRETLKRYVNGALGWKNCEQRVLDGDRVDPRAISTEEEIDKIEKLIDEMEYNIKNAKERLAELKAMNMNEREEEDSIHLQMIDRINEEYVKHCSINRSDSCNLEKIVDKFVGRVLWEFLDKK